MKIKGVGLCVLLLSVLVAASWAFSITSLAAIQKQYLHWNYFSHILMVVLGLGMIILRKADFHAYGFTLKQWRLDLSVAVVCLIMTLGYVPSLVYPSLAGNPLVDTLLKTAAILLAFGLVASKRNQGVEGKPWTSISTGTLAAPLLMVGTNAMAGLGLVASTAVFQFFFAGFGEEILFRGYMQNRLNEDFGKPWKLRGVRFGPGLFISAALFGVLHLLNPFNPLTGSYDLAVWWAVTSGIAGVLFGFVQERTGTVLSASLAHGLVDLGQVIPLLF